MNQSPFSHPPPGLARYGSAPGSLLASIADSVIGGGGSDLASSSSSSAAGGDGMMGRFLAGDSLGLASEPTCRAPAAAAPAPHHPYHNGGLQRSYGLAEISAGDLEAADPRGGGMDSLVRHSSSPAGFFSHLMMDDGFSVARVGQYSQPATNVVHVMGSGRLKSQLSFSRHDRLSQISEICIPNMGESIDGNCSETAGNIRASYVSNEFPMGTWDETNSIVFSGPNKRVRDNNGDITTSLSCIDSQLSMSKASIDMDSVENLFQMQHDSATFKIRAKRGCATHPRSIAERERRTRISDKLRKLQELVPNMDKQTSTSDMLDLAVQHIKELQSQVQELNQERANCLCASKK